MKSFALLGLLGIALALAAAPAAATPIPLTQDYPDLASTTGTVTFTTTGYHLLVTGFLSAFTEAGATHQVAGTGHLAGGTGNYYQLDATLSGTGHLVSGTLSAYGVVVNPNLVVPAATLLTANLTAFGFSGTGNTTVFQLTGDVTGGALASYYTNHQVGVILNPGSNCTFMGYFFTNFGGTNATADTFDIPEPATAALLAAAGLGLAGRRRRAARRH